MEFCPECGTLLRFQPATTDKPAGFFCKGCPYFYAIREGMTIRKRHNLVKPKETYSIINATCPKCNHGRARYEQVHTRSYDEPLSTVYCCMNKDCGEMWQ